MKITGTLIKNYFHCKRQAYLYHFGLNFKNELVRIGDVLHEQQKPKEYVFEKIKVDDIKDGWLIEYKKTSANLKGTRFQVLYYLKHLKALGITSKAIIKDLTYNDEYKITLDDGNIKELELSLEQIKNTLKENMPQRKKLKKNCKGCSFFDYCWI